MSWNNPRISSSLISESQSDSDSESSESDLGIYILYFCLNMKRTTFYQKSRVNQAKKTFEKIFLENMKSLCSLNLIVEDYDADTIVMMMAHAW